MQTELANCPASDWLSVNWPIACMLDRNMYMSHTIIYVYVFTHAHTVTHMHMCIHTPSHTHTHTCAGAHSHMHAHGNLSVQSRSQCLQITSTSSKIVGCTLSFTPGNLWTDPSLTSTVDLLWCYTHPSLRISTASSGKCCRIPKCKLNRCKYSFIPLSIRELNQHR